MRWRSSRCRTPTAASSCGEALPCHNTRAAWPPLITKGAQLGKADVVRLALLPVCCRGGKGVRVRRDLEEGLKAGAFIGPYG